MKALIDGHNIRYHRSGSGEHMLLLHGMTTYSFIWDNLMPGLTARYDVIAPDLLGCGDSDKPASADLSPAAQARMLISFMDRLGLGSVHLVTHDIGGAIGQIMAVKRPARINSLTLINSVGYDYWPVQPIVTFRVPIVRQIAMSALDIKLFRRLVLRGVYHEERVTDEVMEKFFAPILKRDGRNGFLQLAKSLDNTQLMNIIDEIHALRMPVMIVRGDADVYLPSDIAERLHHNIHGSRLERIETAGHVIQLDEPDWLVGLLIDFFNG